MNTPDAYSCEVGRAGVAACRRLLAVEIVRDGPLYRPQCCNKGFVGWDNASMHITRDECPGNKGEQP